MNSWYELLCVCCHFTALSGCLFFVLCHVEEKQSPPNKHGPEEKLLILWLCFDFSLCAAWKLWFRQAAKTSRQHVTGENDTHFDWHALLMHNCKANRNSCNGKHSIHGPTTQCCVNMSLCCYNGTALCWTWDILPSTLLPLIILALLCHVCRFRLFSHVDDPFLDDPLPREYVLYMRPSGPLLQQLSHFWQQSRLSCGKNKAHNIFPHITLCQFFMVSLSLILCVCHYIANAHTEGVISSFHAPFISYYNTGTYQCHS